MLKSVASPGRHANQILITAIGRWRAGRMRGRWGLEEHGTRWNSGFAVHQGSVTGWRHRLLIQGKTTPAGPVHRAEQTRRVFARAQGMRRQSVVTLNHRDLVQL